MCESCPTCIRPAYAPYRRFDPNTGRVREGCVDAFHTGHIVTPSASAEWHNRKDARAIRAKLAKIRAGKGAN